MVIKVQNALDMFPCNFPIDGLVSDTAHSLDMSIMSLTSPQQVGCVVVMEFWK